MNIFDSIQDAIFDQAATCFGRKASWVPSTGGDQQYADVLFNTPDSIKKLGDAEFMPADATAEYRVPFFAELKTLVETGNQEVMTVDGVDFDVRAVKAVLDGKTLIAIIQKRI